MINEGGKGVIFNMVRFLAFEGSRSLQFESFVIVIKVMLYTTRKVFWKESCVVSRSYDNAFFCLIKLI